TLRMSSEYATCPESPHREPPSGCLPSMPHVPEAHTERHPADAMQVRHVSLVPKPRIPSGCHPSSRRVPSAQVERSLRMPSECTTCPESPHQETPPPGTLRVRHVSREVKPFFQPI